jgi:excisionase family DNA binding protein
MRREQSSSFEEEFTAPLTPETWSVREACSILHIAPNTGYKAVREGQIPTIRLGRVLRVPKVALRRLLEGSLDA